MDCKRGYRDKEGSFCTLTLKWPFIIGLGFLGFHVRSKTLQPCAAERDMMQCPKSVKHVHLSKRKVKEEHLGLC